VELLQKTQIVIFFGVLASLFIVLVGRRFWLATPRMRRVLAPLLLAAVAFAPNLGLAFALLLLRSALSQMDVPARQAYVLAMVEPEERTAASAFTNSARYVVRPVGAAGAGALMQRVQIGAPFVVSCALKIVYDIALYLTFRRVPLRERASGERSSETQGSPSSD
jgi:predicted MFS family arabinose efflux permease